MDAPEPNAEVESVAPETVKRRIDDGERVAILDVRAESEFEEWRIDGDGVEVVNVPYFELLDGIDDDQLERIPAGDPTIVVCAKGGSSEYVAGHLVEAGVNAANLEGGMKGWARIYDYRELDADTEATIAQYQRPSSGCLAYMVVSDGEAVVVDPLRAFVGEYVADARVMGADIEYAVDTHVHADHVSGVRELAAETGARVVLPESAVERGVEYDTDYETVADGDALSVGAVDIDVLHTPGHTSGMTSYLVDDAVLLTGDGLFTESVARPDLEGADDEAARAAAGELYDTLRSTILPLDDDVLVAPAHFSDVDTSQGDVSGNRTQSDDAATPREDGTYAARLGDLTARMDALSMDRDEFVEFILSDMPPRPSNYEEIIATNLGRRDAGDEEAFELELGPNNCAASGDAMTSD
ncbi:MBL fold metallo-hydrolase [Halogeometricum luteum]|uniref:MBL fold metallo-hydrolase n=1 Tax=Halogeometricum luteum TaxID=2950537 RepID=A0ABU2FVQ5_9EURY|nr:MBL fold metallo-hydrolase [Halogeometricum sp. S3BR5-2]MDS0292612.1 MBL fold metallo-hydrolase [Halogeometricum sp. S3BR5-2]